MRCFYDGLVLRGEFVGAHGQAAQWCEPVDRKYAHLGGLEGSRIGALDLGVTHIDTAEIYGHRPADRVLTVDRGAEAEILPLLRELGIGSSRTHRSGTAC